MQLKYLAQLVHGRLIKRYKRFLADIILDDGGIITAHCTNSGSMKSCLEEGADVYLSPVSDPKRKTKFTWEMIRINENWVGINTSIPNLLAYEWIKHGVIPGLEGYTLIKREVKYGDSRLDIFAQNAHESCFVEVKNVTMKEGEMALFPDAVTTRGQKHLKTLMELKEQGIRSVMLYVIQRVDVEAFGPASLIDPVYSNLLAQAYENGVEVIPIQVKVSPEGLDFLKILPVRFP